MTTISTVEQLIEVRPDICEPAREWLADITDLADAWDRCHRGDWMLWLCSALDLLDDRELRMIACKCVRETPLADGGKVWGLLTDERSRRAVTVAERYADGDATYEQLATAADSARDAARGAADARDAARGARTAADAAAAVRPTPWNGAEAAARAARTAVDAAYATQADLIREIVGNPWRKEAMLYVTVCDNCKQSSCWQGLFMCSVSRSAGTIDIPLESLLIMGLEHESYLLPYAFEKTPNGGDGCLRNQVPPGALSRQNNTNKEKDQTI